MNKKKNLIFFLFLILLVNCSFDTKTGLWTGGELERERITKLEEEQKKELIRKTRIKKFIRRKIFILRKKL